MKTISKELETARLRLRMLREEDLEVLAAMSADPEVMRYMSGTGETVSRAAAWRTLATILGHWQLRGFGMWAIEEKASGACIGRGGLWRPEGWPAMEVGWNLARSAWGKGYATEMGNAAIKVAREELGAKHLISVIHPDNVRSIRVAERLGSKYEADFDYEGLHLRVYGRDL